MEARTRNWVTSSPVGGAVPDAGERRPAQRRYDANTEQQRKEVSGMSNRYVLIVDDDPDLVETVSMMLQDKGYEVGKAYDGIEGEEAIKKRRPDVVVLDVMMPRKDGYKLCAELKANTETRDIPIVLLTAVGDAVPSTSYTHADGMSTEAEEYIPKPVDTQTLVQAVESFFVA
jgi:DNA-binding response OmpR family regulator